MNMNVTLTALTGDVNRIPLVDATLTKTGWAADAKIVGEQLRNISGAGELSANAIAKAIAAENASTEALSKASEALSKADAAMSKSGGTFTGAVHVSGGAGSVDFFSDNEGGNIVVNSPTANGDYWQMDAIGGDLRMFHGDNSVEIDHSFTIDKDGVIHPTGGYGGGNFTGEVTVSNPQTVNTRVRNIKVCSSAGTQNVNRVNTNEIMMVRK